MKTKFFTELAQYLENNKLSITMQKKAGVISVLIAPELLSAKDKDKYDKLDPLMLSGSAEELDEKFFDLIAEPMKETVAVITNIEQFRAGLKDKEEKATKSKDKPAAGKSADKKVEVNPIDSLIDDAQTAFNDEEYQNCIDLLIKASGIAKTKDHKDKIAKLSMSAKMKLKASEELGEEKPKAKDKKPAKEAPAEEKEEEEEEESEEESEEEGEEEAEETPAKEEDDLSFLD